MLHTILVGAELGRLYGRDADAVEAVHDILGLFPALALPSHTASFAYVGGFCLGTVAAMVGFSTALGWLALRRCGGKVSRQAMLLGGFAVAGLAWNAVQPIGIDDTNRGPQ